MNPVDFTKKWIDGMKHLSPENQLDAAISLCYGNIIGFLGGIITMLYFVIVAKEYRWWWTVLILIIALLSTIVDLIAKKQQKQSLLEMQEQMRLLEQARG